MKKNYSIVLIFSALIFTTSFNADNNQADNEEYMALKEYVVCTDRWMPTQMHKCLARFSNFFPELHSFYRNGVLNLENDFRLVAGPKIWERYQVGNPEHAPSKNIIFQTINNMCEQAIKYEKSLNDDQHYLCTLSKRMIENYKKNSQEKKHNNDNELEL